MVAPAVSSEIRFNLGDALSEASIDCKVVNLVSVPVSWTIPCLQMSKPCVPHHVPVLLTPLHPTVAPLIPLSQAKRSHRVSGEGSTNLYIKIAHNLYDTLRL